ncbi:MAG: M20/M25/M40 family metallo-hydrolase [Planctomycetota bacterium]|jgi:hypothetical protein|nr:M20/M25/M40 family metallo-hydrolase [Planctomycetota bacterium]
MGRRTLLLGWVFALCGGIGGGSWSQESIDSDRIMKHIRYLASDELKGRDAGTPGEEKAAIYIANEFKALGLQPIGDEGSYFQHFDAKGRQARNVVAWLPGSDSSRSHEHVVVGGHFDHVGLGNYGSTWGKGGRGLIHNGADDNASGTAVVIEVARALVREKISLGRSVLFILFTAEERGLLGSNYYVDHPLKPLRDCVGMINLDMVGRGKTGHFKVYGSGSGRGLGDILSKINRKYRYEIDEVPFGVAPSDNTPFYLKQIPVLFFHTGLHPEYHTPWDDVEWVNAENAECVGRFVFDVTRAVCDSPGRISHRWSELHLPSLFQGADSAWEMLQDQLKLAQGGARLGVGVEDVVPLGSGVRVLSVARTGAASRVGIRTGDVLTRLGDSPIRDLDSLTEAVGGCFPGQEVELAYQRDGRSVVVTVRLGRR